MPECQDIITSEEYGDFIWEIADVYKRQQGIECQMILDVLQDNVQL